MKLTTLLLATALIATVSAQFKFTPANSRDSWKVMSPASNNDWKPKNKAGAAIGFTVFGAAYIFAVIKIFIDIQQRDKMYDREIEEDLNQMKALGLDSKMAEINADLQLRLAGVKKEDGADDQLLETAKVLTADQYAKYM